MEIKTSATPVSYEAAVQDMEQRVAGIREGTSPELLWLLEHPPLYTAGTSAKSTDLLKPRFPVFQTGRGGQYTYHGPGQRVAYVMLDLKKRQQTPDLKKYIWQLEDWLIQSLRHLDINGGRRDGRVGIWVGGPTGEVKIAAIGVRVRHWVTYHGVSVNLNPDLSHYDGIVPCGLSDYGVTSISRLTGNEVSMSDLDQALIKTWPLVFRDAPAHERAA